MEKRTRETKNQNEIKRFGLIFMPINWVVCLIVTITLYFTLGSAWAQGYLLGSITSYLAFGLHMKNANDYGNPKANKTMHLFTNVGVRLFLQAVILLVSFMMQDTFNLLATFIGLCVIKVLLIFYSFAMTAYDNQKKAMEAQAKDEEEGGE